MKKYLSILTAFLTTTLALNAKDIWGDPNAPRVAISAQRPEILVSESDLMQKAGFVTTFTQKFFDDYNVMIMKIFKEKMQSFRLEDNCSEFKVMELITPKLCVSNQKLAHFDVDLAKSELKIDSTEKKIKMSIEGIDLRFKFKYDISSDPSWLRDSGEAYIDARKCAVRLNLVPSTENNDGLLHFDFNHAEIFIHQYEVKTGGSSDLSRALEIIFNSFKSFFKNELANMLAWRMAKSVEESMNTMMTASAGFIELPGVSNVFLNATMLGDPIFHSDYLSILMDGSFVTQDTKNNMKASDEQKHWPMPAFIGKNAENIQVQVFVSENTLNTALEMLHLQNVLQVSHKVESAYMKTFFPNFQEVFGNQKSVTIKFESLAPAKIEISSGVSKVSAPARLGFLNPFNEDYQTVDLTCKFEANIEFALLENFVLAGTVKDLNLTVTDMKVYFLTETSLAKLQSQVKALSDPLTKIINAQLQKGYGLPIPRHVSAELSNTRVFNYDHFLMVESDPQIEGRIQMFADESIGKLHELVNQKMKGVDE